MKGHREFNTKYRCLFGDTDRRQRIAIREKDSEEVLGNCFVTPFLHMHRNWSFDSEMIQMANLASIAQGKTFVSLRELDNDTIKHTCRQV